MFMFRIDTLYTFDENNEPMTITKKAFVDRAWVIFKNLGRPSLA
jgi:hypothetical protein